MKGLLTLFLILFGGSQLFGQEQAFTSYYAYYDSLYESANGNLDLLKGSGYMQYVRNKHFIDERINADGNLTFENRWEQFKSIREGTLSDRSGSPVAEWENIGPLTMDVHGGRVISHAFDPVDTNTLWVGSASGGLWLTEDNCETWQPKTNDIPSSGVGAIAVNPFDPNMLVIGTGEGYAFPGISIKGGVGVFKSTDKGETWAPTSFIYPYSNGVSALKMVWHPTDENIIWLAATNGLWKSEDQGETWALIIGDATNHGNYIFDDFIIQQDNPDIMFAAQENVGILRSTDGGENFDLIEDGILPTENINFISIDQCRDFPDVLVASICEGTSFGLEGLYRSTDNGLNWERIATAPDAQCYVGGGPGGATYCQGWFTNTVGVSPVNPNLIFLGGISLWRTDDGGLTWDQKDKTICPFCPDTPECRTWVDHHDFGFSPFLSNRCYSFNDGGVGRSHDEGVCFENVNEGLICAQLLSATASRRDPNILSGGFWDHGLLGANIGEDLRWERWGFFDGCDVEIHLTNPDIFYGTWIDGSYWKSFSGFESYATEITAGMDLTENTSFHFAPIRMSPFNGNLLLGSTQQGIYRSTNAGTTWNKVQSTNIATDLAFSEADSSRAYAAAWNNSFWIFYTSSDAGESWIPTSSSPGWRVTDVKTSGTDPLTVFACRNSAFPANPHVYKSTDGGNTWESIQGDLPDIQTNAIAIDLFNHDIIYAATDLGVFITCDGGMSWNEYNHGLPVTFVNDVEFNPTDTTLVAATYGRGTWKTKAFVNYAAGVPDAEPLENTFAVKSYPNPSNGTFNLAFKGNYKTVEKIAVLNELGQSVSTIFTKSGDTELQQNLSVQLNLPAGQYYLEMINDTQVTYKPIVLIKN